MMVMEAVGRTGRVLAASWHAATLPYRVVRHRVRRAGMALREAYREQYYPELPLGTGGGVDDDDWKYRRLTQARRDLSPLQQSRQLQIAHWLRQRNPVAKRIVEMLVDYVVGPGVVVGADDPDVAAVVRRFWGHPVNGMDHFTDDLTRELSTAGELFIPVFVNKVNGEVRLGWLDPADVSAVLMSHDNRRLPVAVRVATGAALRDKYLRVLRPEGDLPGETAYRLHDEGETVIDPSVGSQPQPLVGDCFVFQINKPPGASRGVSDLLPLADWLDNFDQAQWNALDRVAFLNNFVWDVTLDGADEQTVRRWLAQQDIPKPGSLRAHNESVKWDAVTPDLKMGDLSDGVRVFLNHILGGAGFPSHWFGAAPDVNRATALSMHEPTEKMLTRRQGVMAWVFGELCRFAVDMAVAHGQLADMVADGKRSRDLVTVTMPKLSARDTKDVAASARDLVQALDLAVSNGWLSVGTAREALATVLRQLGVEVDLTEEAGDARETVLPDLAGLLDQAGNGALVYGK